MSGRRRRHVLEAFVDEVDERQRRVEVAARRVQRADRTAAIGQCRTERQVTLCGRRERVLTRGRFGKLQQLVKIFNRPEWRQIARRNAIGERARVHRLKRSLWNRRRSRWTAQGLRRGVDRRGVIVGNSSSQGVLELRRRQREDISDTREPARVEGFGDGELRARGERIDGSQERRPARTGRSTCELAFFNHACAAGSAGNTVAAAASTFASTSAVPNVNVPPISASYATTKLWIGSRAVGSCSVGAAVAGGAVTLVAGFGRSKNLRTWRMNAAIRSSGVPGDVNDGSRSICVDTRRRWRVLEQRFPVAR